MARQFVASESDRITTDVSVYHADAAGEFLTVSAWVYCDTATGHMCVCGVRDDGVGGWYFYWNSGGTLRFITRSPAGSDTGVQSDAYTPTTGVWERWAAVYTYDTDAIDFYVNGAAKGSDTSTTKMAVSGVDAFPLGARISNSTHDLFFDGRIADLAVWSVALTANEVAAHHAGVPANRIQPLSLQHNWLSPGDNYLVDFGIGTSHGTNVGSADANHAPLAPYSSRFWAASGPLVEAAAGGQTVTPVTQTAVWAVQAPTATLTLSVTPVAQTAAWEIQNPSITVGGVTQTPTNQTAVWGVQAPTATSGLTASPVTQSAAWAVQNPSATKGGVSQTPVAQTAQWSIQSPTVTQALSVTPVSQSAAWTVTAPSVTSGGLSVTPTNQSAAWGVQSPSVTRGGVSQTPTAQTAAWSIQSPAVSAGGLFTPVTQSAAWSIQAPAITRGGVSQTPVAQTAVWAVQSPTASVVAFDGSVLGTVTLLPAIAGIADVDKATKGTTTLGGAVTGTATLG